jgi:hypothetical protein
MIPERIWNIVSDSAKKEIKAIVVRDIAEVIGEDLGYQLVEKTTSVKPQVVKKKAKPRRTRTTIDKSQLRVFGKQYKNVKEFAEHNKIPAPRVREWLKEGSKLEDLIKLKNQGKNTIIRNGGVVH